ALLLQGRPAGPDRRPAAAVLRLRGAVSVPGAAGGPEPSLDRLAAALGRSGGSLHRRHAGRRLLGRGAARDYAGLCAGRRRAGARRRDPAVSSFLTRAGGGLVSAWRQEEAVAGLAPGEVLLQEAWRSFP